MTVDLHEAAFIYLDTFPAYVTLQDNPSALPGSEYRAIATDNRFYVLDDSVDGILAHINTPLISFSGNHADGFVVVTEDGTFTVKRAPSCGCGSRIRGYHPFLGVPYEANYPKGTPS